VVALSGRCRRDEWSLSPGITEAVEISLMQSGLEELELLANRQTLQRDLGVHNVRDDESPISLSCQKDEPIRRKACDVFQLLKRPLCPAFDLTHVDLIERCAGARRGRTSHRLGRTPQAAPARTA
jgi:hypothetical protein